jgi:phosphatase NudJ
MAREPIATWFFAVTVVVQRVTVSRQPGRRAAPERKSDTVTGGATNAVVGEAERFLLVHERKHRGWYLPAGRAEPGETLAAAAVRETREESGVDVELTGVLRIEHSPGPTSARVSGVFVARPIGGSPRATDDSLDARFVTLEEARALPLRGPDVLRYLEHVAGGGRILPLDAITTEDGE